MIKDLLDSIAITKKLYAVSLEPVYKQYGLTKMELDIILFLANNPGYDSAKDLMERRLLTKSHVSTTIKSLIEKKYLKSTYLHNNKKTVHLVLLDSSIEIVKAGQLAQKKFIEAIFKDFTKSDKQIIINSFSKISQNASNALKEEQ